MTDTLLAHVLTCLDHLEAPVIAHADVAGFPPQELQYLLSDGILRESSRATEIPRPRHLPPGGHLLVRRTARGLYGVADEDDFFAPVPLQEDDIRQYEVSIPRLIGALKRDNGIEGGDAVPVDHMAHLGQLPIAGFGVVDVHLCLASAEEAGFLSRCQRMRRSPGTQRAVVLTLTSALLSMEAQLLLDSLGVTVVSLLPAARRATLRQDWSTVLAAVDQVAGTSVSTEARVFQREGATWRLVFEGKSRTAKHSKGMEYLAVLLRHRGEEFHAARLRALAAGKDEVVVLGPGDEILDDPSLKKIHERLRELDAEIQEAEDDNNLGLLGSLKEEHARLLEDVGRATGLRGRRRRIPGPSEKARQALSKAVHRALDEVEANHQELGTHLRNAVTIGEFLAYRPDQPMHWFVKT